MLAAVAAGWTGLVCAAGVFAQPTGLRTSLGSSLRSHGLRSRTPHIEPVPVEGLDALRHFHRALEALARNPDRRVRVLHYGDSNVAADIWTMVAREALQARFGNGGSGYLLPRGHGSWHRTPVRIESEGDWRSRRRGFAQDYGPADGLWGLSGVGMEPASPNARLRLEIPAGITERIFELHALGRPRPSGALAVRIDGGEWHRVELLHDRPALVLRRWNLDATAHAIEVRHAGGRPRILGVVVENPSGLVYDVLGINGHRASAINHWNAELLRSQLVHRRPDLLILSYGGNEALDPHLPMDAYESQTRAAVTKMRSVAPGASCLLVGPLASMPRYAERMQAVTAVQRRLAPELGCGFWDSSRTSGGHGTLGRWIRFPGMVSTDGLHLGRQGYERVGQVFVRALLQGL